MSEEEILTYLYYFTSSNIKNKKLNLQDGCGFNLGFLYVETLQKTVKGLLDLYNKEKEKNKALKEGLKYRINYCKLLEKELYANGVNYEFEKTEIEKQFLEE